MTPLQPGQRSALSVSGLRDRAFAAYQGWVRLALALAVVGYGATWLTGVFVGNSGPSLVAEGLAAAVAALSLVLALSGHLQLATFVFLGTMFVQLNVATFLRGDLRGSALLIFPAGILATGLLLGGRWAWLAALVTAVSAPAAAVLGARAGMGPGLAIPGEVPLVVVLVASLVTTAALVHAGMTAFGRVLAESEHTRRRFAQLVEDAPDGILALREDRTIRDANPAACGLLGATRDELRGMALPEALGPAAARRLSAWLDGVAEEGVSLPVVLADARGEERTLEVTARRTEDGTGPGFQVMLRDISDRVALQRRDTQMGRLLSEAGTEIMIFHREDGSLLQVSRGAQAALGLSPEDIPGVTAGRICPTLDGDGLQRLVSRLEAAAGRPVRERGVHRRRDGSVYPVESEYLSFRLEGEPVVVSFAVNITERIQAEEEQERLQRQLEHAQRMEAVGHLAGGVAHDFNNLLTVMGACAETLRDEVPPESLELVDEMIQAQERGAVLTRQLLTFARKEVVQPETLSVRQALDQMEVLARRVLSEQCDLTLAVEGDPWIEADRGQFEQVMINLLANARDAMPRGGSVRLEVRTQAGPVGVGGVPGPARVGIHVVDQGSGMDDATRQKIFEPFFTTKERGKGTGLGLATVLAIVSEAGGEVEVETAPDRGTRMSILWPAVEPAAEPDRAPRSTAPHAGRSGVRARVLFAEDNDAARTLLTRLLTRHGHLVESARDGEDALECYDRAEQDFDILISDVVMPRRSGIELADALAERGFAGPVLFISGYLDGHLPRDGTVGRGRDLLLKPFRHDEFLERVNRLLASD